MRVGPGWAGCWEGGVVGGEAWWTDRYVCRHCWVWMCAVRYAGRRARERFRMGMTHVVGLAEGDGMGTGLYVAPYCEFV